MQELAHETESSQLDSQFAVINSQAIGMVLCDVKSAKVVSQACVVVIGVRL